MTDNPGGAQISGIHRDSAFTGPSRSEPYRMPDITLTADNGQPFNLITDTALPGDAGVLRLLELPRRLPAGPQ